APVAAKAGALFKAIGLGGLATAAVVTRRVGERALERAAERLVVLEADGERDVEDRIVGNRQLVRRPLEAEAVDVLLGGFADGLGEEAVEVERRVAVPPRQRLEVDVSVEVVLNVDQ